MNKLILILLFSLIRTFTAFGQQLHNPYEDYPDIWQDVSNDLFLHYIEPYNRIHSIANDDSLIWFGLSNGVMKYNKLSQQRQVFTLSDGMVYFGFNTHIFILPDKVIVCGWSGLNIYDKVIRKWTPLVVPNVEIGSARSSIGFVKLYGDELWIGGSCGLLKYSIKKEKWTTIVKPESNVYYYDLSLAKKHYWYSTRWSISRIRKNGKADILIQLFPDYDSRRSIRCILYVQGHLFVGTTGGMVIIDDGGNIKKPLTFENESFGEDCYKIFHDKGIIWTITSRGVMVYDIAADKFTKLIYKNDDIRGRSVIFQDTCIWIIGKSIWKQDRQSHRFEERNIPCHFELSSFNESMLIDNDIWLVGYGAVQYSIKSGIARYFGINDHYKNNINAIFCNREIVLAGSDDGLREYSCRNKQWVKYRGGNGVLGSYIKNIIGDEDQVWILSYWGIAQRNKRDGKYLEYPFAQGSKYHGATSFIEFNNKEIWIGTTSGVKIYRIDNNELHDSGGMLLQNETTINNICKNGDEIWLSGTDAIFQYNILNSICKKYTLNIKTIHWKEDIVDINKERKKIEIEEWSEVPQPYYNVDHTEMVDSIYWVIYSLYDEQGTKKAFISKYNLLQNKWERVHKNIEQIPGNMHKFKIYRDVLWIVTESGVYSLDLSNNVMTSIQTQGEDNLPNSFQPAHVGLISKHVNLFAINDSDVWFGTKKGISCYNKTKNNWESHFWAYGYTGSGPSKIINNSRYIWKQANVSPGWGAGWDRFDKRKKNWAAYENSTTLWNAIQGSITNDDSTIYLGTKDGVRQLFVDSCKWLYYVSEKPILRLTLHKNNLWAVTADDVRKYNVSKRGWDIFEYDKNKIHEPGIICGYLDKIWIGHRHGCAYWDIEKNNFQYLNCKKNRPIENIIPQGESMLLIDRTFYPYIYRNDSLQQIGYPKWPGSSRCVAYDSSGVWVITNNGIYKYLAKSDSWIEYDKPGNIDKLPFGWFCFTIDKNKAWIGLNDGVVCVDLDKLKPIKYKKTFY